jgi:putative spermidine/putrescine transport system substrate-binding protein
LTRLASHQVAKPHELLILSWGGQWDLALRSTVSDPYEALTGIRVRHVPYVGLGLPSWLTDAVANGHPPRCHVVWCHSVSAASVAAAGQAEVLDEESVPHLAGLCARSVPRGHGATRIVFPYVLYYVLVYRKGSCGSGGPESWEVLLDPRYRRKLACYPGGNGLFGLAQVLGGGTLADIPDDMTACWSFLRELRSQDPVFEYSVGGMAHHFSEGTLTLAIRALANALGFQADGAPVDWVAPREGLPDATDALWVPFGHEANVAHWAKRYIDFALTDRVQERWCEMLGTMPMHPGAAIPSSLQRLCNAPKGPESTVNVLHIDDGIRLEHEPFWTARFDSLFRAG